MHRWARDWRLCDKDYGGIIWVDEREFVLDARALLDLYSKVEIRNLLHRRVPDLLKAEPPASEELRATTVHEPHLELRVSWQRSRLEWLHGALDVVRAKDGLLKRFLEHQG